MLQISVSVSDIGKLENAQDMLKNLGINSNIYEPKDPERVGQLYINGKDNINKFKEKIGFEHPIKNEKLSKD